MTRRGDGTPPPKGANMRTIVSKAMPLLISLAALLLLCSSCADSDLSPEAVAGVGSDREELMEIGIVISPATLVLDSAGTCVTVHAEIGYYAVDLTSLRLEGLSATSTKPDDRGELVVKLRRDDVENIVTAPEATLTLTGVTKSGVSFFGTDTIAVK